MFVLGFVACFFFSEVFGVFSEGRCLCVCYLYWFVFLVRYSARGTWLFLGRVVFV